MPQSWPICGELIPPELTVGLLPPELEAKYQILRIVSYSDNEPVRKFSGQTFEAYQAYDKTNPDSHVFIKHCDPMYTQQMMRELQAAIESRVPDHHHIGGRPIDWSHEIDDTGRPIGVSPAAVALPMTPEENLPPHWWKSDIKNFSAPAVFVVQKFINGGELTDWINARATPNSSINYVLDTSITEAEVLHLVAPVIDAIHAMHRRGIAHRSQSPCCVNQHPHVLCFPNQKLPVLCVWNACVCDWNSCVCVTGTHVCVCDWIGCDLEGTSSHRT
jgi:serine/threonine protein kinase